MQQNRFRSWATWTALAALIGLFINDAGWVTPEKYQQYVDLFLGLLVALGVINNPTIKDKL